MRRSSSTRSGCSRRTSGSTCAPFEASPTTLNPPAFSSACFVPSTINRWSSAIKTFIDHGIAATSYGGPSLRRGIEGRKLSRKNHSSLRSFSMLRQTSSNGRSAPRVLVAGNDSATINGIRLALEQEGIVLCGQVASAAELADAVTRLEPDLCLVDVDLPGGGIVAAAEMRAWRSRVAVVILASEPNEEDFLKAMAVGAIGYLPKSISPKRLPAVVRAVLLGEPAIPRPLVAVLMNRLRGGGTRRHLVAGDRRGVHLTR